MNIEELKEMEWSIVTDAEFDDIWEMPEVVRIDNNGLSDSQIGKIWYTIVLEDSTQVQIYN